MMQCILMRITSPVGQQNGPALNVYGASTSEVCSNDNFFRARKPGSCPCLLSHCSGAPSLFPHLPLPVPSPPLLVPISYSFVFNLPFLSYPALPGAFAVFSLLLAGRIMLEALP